MTTNIARSDVKFSTVNVDDLEISLFESGTGHPVILLHGSGPGASAWANFEPNVGPLSQHFRVIGLDFPGWGGSSPAVPGDVDLVAIVLGVMDTLGIERAALIGNSLGGATALKLAADRPDRVSALVTMGVHSGIPTAMSPSGPSEGILALVGAYRDPTPTGMGRLVSAMTYSPEFGNETLIEARSRAALESPDHLANFLISFERGQFLKPPATLTDYGRIAAPTLLVHGRDDRVLPYEHSLVLLPLIRDSRLLLLNRCGHWAQLEHANEFNRATIDFITEATTRQVSLAEAQRHASTTKDEE